MSRFAPQLTDSNWSSDNTAFVSLESTTHYPVLTIPIPSQKKWALTSACGTAAMSLLVVVSVPIFKYTQVMK
jgi:hypothetical protein